MDKEHDEYEEYAAVISALPDMVFVLTESGRYAAIFGGDSSDFYHDGSSLKGMTLFNVLPEDKANWFLDKIKETLAADKLMVFEYSLSANDVETVENDSGPAGKLRFEGRVNPLKSLRYGERAVVWVARNITNRHEIEQQLIYQSEIDDLSKTLNRRKLFEHLNDALYTFQRYRENYCFLLIDIDNFKQVNDSLGHCFGDKAIQKIAELCQAQIRKTDVIGRIGGDEFGIIVKDNSELPTITFAQRLIEAVSNIELGEGTHTIRLSISIGLSQFQHTDQSTAQIYQRADLALYDAKDRGKNRLSTKFV